MGNYGDLQNRIASEIKRSGLTIDIQNAIHTAIQAYESRPFWFTQQRSTLNTIAGQKIYGLPLDFKKMRILRIMQISLNPAVNVLNEVTTSELSDNDLNLSGIPTDYYVDWLQRSTPPYDGKATIGQLWLMPTPNAILSMELQYFRNIGRTAADMGPLLANGDENAWTNEGELLIRCRAKQELYAHVIRDTTEAVKWEMKAQQAAKELMQGNIMRHAPARLSASW